MFIMLLLKGSPGAGNLDIKSVSDKLKQIRALTNLPVGVGFGIKDAKSAAAVADESDAVVVGSALVQKVEQSLTQHDKITEEIVALLSDMRRAIDN